MTLLVCHTSSVRQPPGASASYVHSHVDVGAQEDDAVSGQTEVFAGVGGDMGGGEEQAFTPGGHARFTAGAEFDLGEEVGRGVQVEASFGLFGGERGERGGDVGGLGVAEADGDVGDAVSGVAEVVDGEAFAGRHP